IFTLGIFLILIVPFIQPFIPMIPNIGDDIQDSFKYIPFTYLTEKMTGEIKFSNWQWFISIASIVVLFIANMLYASKRDI
ncbi:MAG: phenol-soluble modulin export ABC transporter permease subunit PmtD, partial [Staphylococcus epidermidis]